MENKIEVSVEGDAKTLVIREGKAIPHYDKEIINIAGVINSPRLFWEKRKAEHELLKCHILYTKEDYGNGIWIELVLDETDHFKGSVKGRLEPNPLIAAFGINTDKAYSIETMKKLLRMNRAYFQDREANMALVSNLEKFHAQVKMDIENKDDNRGNYTHSLSQTVKAEFPLDFSLNFPPYKGGKSQAFKCEICFAITSGVTTIWFESPELQEILISIATGIIDKELKAFDEIVCIEK